MDINGLEDNSKFKRIISILNTALDNLDKQINEQIANLSVDPTKTIDVGNIKNGLENIDSFIMNNPLIQRELINGNEDIKKIVEAINEQVSKRLEELKDNIKESEHDDVNTLKSDFENNDMNKRQNALDEFDDSLDSISGKSEEERLDEAKKKAEEYKEKIENAKVFEKLKNDNSAITVDDLKKDVKVANKDFINFDTIYNKYNNVKEASEYEKILTDIRTLISSSYNGRHKYNGSIDRKFIENSIKELKILKNNTGNTDLDKLINDIESFVTNTTAKNVDKSIETLFKEMNDPKAKSIDFENAVEQFNNKKDKFLAKELNNLMKHDVFKYCKNKEEIEDLINGENPDIEQAKTIIDEFLADTKLQPMIEQSEKDFVGGIDKLKDEHYKYDKVVRNLSDRNLKKSTANIEYKGEKIGLTNESGEVVDFTKLDENSKIEATNSIFEKLNADGKITKEIEEQYNKLPVAIKNKNREKPGLFSRFIYKANPTHWFNGKSLVDVRKEESKRDRDAYIEAHITAKKEEIMEEIDKLKDDADKRPSWYLSPGEQKAFRDKEIEIAEEAKKSARKSIIIDGKSGKDAVDEAKENIENEQFKEDSEER